MPDVNGPSARHIEDEMRPELICAMIDANWSNSTDVIYQFCRQSNHLALPRPSHGRYVGASSAPFSEYSMGLDHQLLAEQRAQR
jgi:hypothetical protein